MATNQAIAPFKTKEPLNKINGVNVGTLATIECPPVKRIAAITLEPTITLSAINAVKGIPTPADVLGLITLKVGGKPQRSRLASELFGGTGLNALCDAMAAGTVQYFQGGVAINAVPSVLGSAADLAAQAALAVNTATTARFELPIQFSEPFRKEYAMTEAMALVQAFADGTGVGLVTVECVMGGATATHGANTHNLTGHDLKAFYEYDELLGAAGSSAYLSKEYRHTVQYAAAGDIEVATQLYNRDALQRVSLLTTADVITRVVVKQGSRVLRDLTNVRNSSDLIRKDYNPSAMIPNRFDIEFDDNDNPNSAPLLNTNQPLSIVATLATAADATKNIIVLSSYYGPLD